jgi:holo-[acyl-carrier protein] synthase
MQGVGVDIVSIDRVRDAVDTAGEAFLGKVFTTAEREHAKAHANPVTRLAMLFAGKEAIFKTFGVGWGTGVRLSEIEITDGECGEPVPNLKGRFMELASERGVDRVLLSMSYDGEYAVAVAALHRED